MLSLSLAAALRARSRPVLVALGAHCDDIEIGAGGTLSLLAEQVPGLTVVATVFASTAERAAEARAALPAFVAGARLDLAVSELPDGRLPAHWLTVKELLHATRDRAEAAGGADLVFAPTSTDAHQDHRLVAELALTVFRDQPLLGYEILKYDGDLGRPNVYLGIPDVVARRKSALLHEHFPSQKSHSWFDEETFLALLRVRGVESNQRYAEAFVSGKLLL